MLALVWAKRSEFLLELETNDLRKLMYPEMLKQEKIALSINIAPGITCYKSAEAYKYKWQTLLRKYKKVVDMHKETWVNSMLYFEVTFQQRRERVLTKFFDSFVYTKMHEWYNTSRQ